jgi:hypothetical protein
VADEDEDREITNALAKLKAQDPRAADDAEAALEWIAGEHGPSFITQERIQHYLWYGLPTKWMTELDHKQRIVVALGRALDLLGLSRYAEICRSGTTESILRAYDEDDDKGLNAFREAEAASGIQPPNLPELEWGAVMGWEEASALSSTADFLELAITGGDLVPGARGWKRRQRELVRAHLDTPRVELAGQTLAQVVLTERIESWLNAHRSETRRKILSCIANRLLHPVELAADAADYPFPPLRWFLDELADGIPLTQTGNLSQKFVQGAADRFGWDFSRPPRTEDELYDLHQLRCLAKRLGLARRTGGKIGLTAKGRSLLEHPQGSWRIVAGGVLGKNAFSAFAGELFLSLLVDAASLRYDDIEETVGQAAAEEGFRDTRTGEPPDERALGWAIHETSNLCRALGVLSVGGSWRDRSYGFTHSGKAAALEALRARAIGPRSSPWG